MSNVTADLFCDPFSPAGWRLQPVLRHVEYAFPEITWIPRPVVEVPTPLREGDAEAFARRALGDASPPVAVDALADEIPASWAACEAVVAVRATAPDRALAYLHRLRAETFAAGRPPTTADDLAALAESISGVDADAVAAAVGSRRAATAVGRDLQIGRDLLDDLTGVDVRGDPGTRRLAPRSLLDSDEADTDESDSDEAGTVVPRAPLIRFRYEDRTAVVDPRMGFAEFRDVLRGFDPDLGDLDWTAEIHGRKAMQAYGVPQRIAENLSNEQYAPRVREVLEHFEEAYLAEIAACTDLDPDTCRLAVRELRVEGQAHETDAGAWRRVPEDTD